MKHPLVLAAICYGAGIFTAMWVSLPLSILFPAAFLFLLIAILRPTARYWALGVLLFVAGGANFVSRTVIVSPHDLRNLVREEHTMASVRGRLLATPSLRVFQRRDLKSYRTIAEVDVTALNRGTNWHPATGRIVVTSSGILPTNFFVGREVEIAGVLSVPPPPIAEGLFDYRGFLERQGIYFRFGASTNINWRVTDAASASPYADRFLDWAQGTLGRGMPEDESLKLTWAMTLGWKTALTDEVSEPFMQSGTMHIFAISGLHIALIAGIWVILLRACRVPRSWCWFIVIPLIWLYTMATGWQPSAIRSTVMMTIVIGGWALRRPTDLLNSLAAAALIILLWDPKQLGQASFQLSFFVVLSIALLSPPLEKWRDRLFRIDPMLPADLLPRWQRILRPPLRWLANGLITSLAAWLGSLPLTAYYFHILSPVTLLANLVIVPLSSLALAANMGSLIFGDWFPWATELFNHSGWWLMLWMVKFSNWFATWPNGFFYVPSPSIDVIVIYYALLIGIFKGWVFKKIFRAWTIIGLILIAGFYGWRWQASRSEIRMTVLPLEGGHGVFVDAAGRKNDWLIDCGSTNSFGFTMKPFLRGQGVNYVSQLLLTHGDLQHVGGTQLVESEFGVGKIYNSAVRSRSTAYRRIVAKLEETPERHRVINCGDEAGVWRVLHPQATDKFPQGDDNGLVLLGTIQGTRVLLLADLGRPGQEALLSRTNDLRAEIVVTGLPEQTEPLCDALIEAIRPKLIIIADSEFPAQKRVSARVSERIESHNIPVKYTRKHGAVTLTFRSDGWKFK